MESPDDWRPGAGNTAERDARAGPTGPAKSAGSVRCAGDRAAGPAGAAESGSAATGSSYRSHAARPATGCATEPAHAPYESACDFDDSRGHRDPDTHLGLAFQR